jgi:hypothetical protein
MWQHFFGVTWVFKQDHKLWNVWASCPLLDYPMDAIVPGPNPVNIVGEHIEFDLRDGFTALFDLEVMDKISRHKWVPFHNGNHFSLWLS